MRRLASILFILAIVLWPFLFIFLASIPYDIVIEPEYISGLLAASSILFGLWSFATKPYETAGEVTRRFFGLYGSLERILLLVNLLLLFVCVFCIFLSIVGVIPSLFTLCLLISSFNANCVLLVSYLF